MAPQRLCRSTAVREPIREQPHERTPAPLLRSTRCQSPDKARGHAGSVGGASCWSRSSSHSSPGRPLPTILMHVRHNLRAPHAGASGLTPQPPSHHMARYPRLGLHEHLPCADLKHVRPSKGPRLARPTWETRRAREGGAVAPRRRCSRKEASGALGSGERLRITPFPSAPASWPPSTRKRERQWRRGKGALAQACEGFPGLSRFARGRREIWPQLVLSGVPGGERIGPVWNSAFICR